MSIVFRTIDGRVLLEWHKADGFGWVASFPDPTGSDFPEEAWIVPNGKTLTVWVGELRVDAAPRHFHEAHAIAAAIIAQCRDPTDQESGRQRDAAHADHRDPAPAG